MTDKKYILVIDNGLTVIKSAIIDCSGRLVNSYSEPNIILDNPLFSEIDPNYLWIKTAETIKNVIIKSGVRPSNIAAIGNTGFGAGIFLADKNGQPVRNAITSMDARAADYASTANKKDNIFFSRTKINMWGAQAIPLLHWLKNNEKDNYQRIHRLLQVKDWIKFMLTGVYSTDFTDAGNTGLINLNKKNYDSGIYEYFNLSEMVNFLPALKNCHEVTGYINKQSSAITGLLEGTPVMSGLIDVVACAVGSGLYKEDKYSIISGTWNINTAVSSKITESHNIMSCFLYADSKKYFAMDASPTSAVNLEWFIKSVIEKTYANNFDRKIFYKRIDREIINRLNKASSLIYLPFIYRSKLVNNVMGSFLGINSTNDVFDLIYSIYQGVAFAHLLHLDNLKKGGVIRNFAVLSGGASNSSLWCQVFADVLNMKVQTVTASEVGLLGTAISVLMGFENISLEQAIAKTVAIKSVFTPDKEMNKIYMERFTYFKDIIKLLD